MKEKLLLRLMLLLMAVGVFGFSQELTAQQADNLPEGFVYSAGRKFMISDGAGGGDAYYFSGTNNYYMMYKPMEMNVDVMNDMVHLGQKAVRMWIFMDGDSHDGYVLQPEAGVYDEATMVHMDEIFEELNKRGLKAIPVFVNYWSDFGGMAQYAEWAGTNATQFFSNASCKQTFKDYMAMWANRVNTKTGIAYKDDPTILSWQLTNEARASSSTLGDMMTWTEEMSDYLREQDPNHMISLGDEGLMNYAYDDIATVNAGVTDYQITNDWPYAGSMGDWEAVLQMPNISFGTIHNYATDNWGYTVEWGEAWTKHHVDVANSYNKPCIMEEYDKAYSGQWSTTADQERAEVLDKYQTIIRDWDMAGDMSWMLVGRNYTDPVASGYTMDNTAPVDQIWLYRVKWPGDGHQYSRYDPYTGPMIMEHTALMNAKSGDSGPLKPIADGGAEQTVIDSDEDGMEIVSLDASGSFDPDGTIASYKWSLNGTQVGTGVNTSISLAIGTHNVTLTVTDNDGETGTDAVAIAVLEGGARIFESESAALAGGPVSAADASASNGQMVQLPGAGSITFNIDNVPAALTYPVTIVHRSYNGTTANGSKKNYVASSAGGGTIDQTFEASTTWKSDVLNLPLAVGNNTITISANWGYVEYDYISVEGIGDGTTVINQLPIANAGSDVTVSDSDEDGLESVTLDGSASSDLDGTIDNYLWVQDGITLGSASSLTADFSVGSNTVVLTVTDNEGATATDYVTVKVNAGTVVNEAPVANAGADQSITDSDESGSETISVSGAASSDADGSIVSYLWSNAGLPLGSGETLSVDLEVGTHNVALVVTDDAGASNTDYVSITVSSSDTGGGQSCSSDAHCPVGYVCEGWPSYSCVADGTDPDPDPDPEPSIGANKIGILWTSWDVSHFQDYTTYINNMDTWGIEYVSINPTYFVNTYADGIITEWGGAEKTPSISLQKSVIKELLSRDYYINYRPHIDPIKYAMTLGATRDNWNTIPGGQDWRGKFDQFDPTDPTIGYRELVILPGLQMLAEAIRESGAPTMPIRYDLGAELMDAMLNYPHEWIALRDEVEGLLATTYSDVAEHITLSHNFCHHIELLLSIPEHQDYFERIEPDQQLNPEGQFLDREGVTDADRAAIGQYIAGLDEITISQYMPLDIFQSGATTTPDEVEQALLWHEDNFINEVLIGALGIASEDIPILHVGEYGMGWRGLAAPNVWDADAWVDAGAGEYILTETEQKADAAIAIDGIVQYVAEGSETKFNSFLLWFGGAPYDVIGINEHSAWYNEPAANALDAYWSTHNGAPSPLSPPFSGIVGTPTANAGADQMITDVDQNGVESVTLNSSLSSDDGSIIAYSWSVGGSEVATGVNTTIDLSVGVNTVTLTVTDNEGLTDTDVVIITVNPGENSTSNGFHVSGTQVLDANGNAFVIRGVSHAHTWYPEQTTSALQNIANTGANAVRVVLSNGERWTRNSGSEVESIIAQCKSLSLIPILEVHDATGWDEQTGAANPSSTVDYWLSSDILPAIEGEEEYVIINIANEPFGNTTTDLWASWHTSAIESLRNGGINHAIMIDAPNWGQDWSNTMSSNAQSIMDSDPDHNVIFSVHMYEVYGDASKVQSYLQTFSNLNLPLVVGEFADTHGGSSEVAEQEIMQYCEQYGFGYIGWSWSGNGVGLEELDIVYNFSTSLTTWGDKLINGQYGIATTSSIATVFDGIINQTPIANAGADQSVVDNDLNGSESVSLDGTASTDAEGPITSYVWTEGATTVATGVNPNVEFSIGLHTVTLTVTDQDGATATDIVEIVVEDGTEPNAAPIAEAGTNVSIVDVDENGIESIILDGSASTDDKAIVSYSWTVGGSEIATGVSPTVDFTVGSHLVTLTVTDAEGLTNSDDVRITIEAAPIEDASLEAEDAALSIVTVVSDASASNGAYVHIQGEGSITWTFNSTNAGTQTIKIGYLLPHGDKNQYVSVNGQSLGSVVFDGATNTWLEKSIEVDLVDGSNTVTITKHWGYMYFDYLSTATAGDEEPVNAAPVANAGANATTIDSDNNGNESISLDASASSDDSAITSYVWTEDNSQIAIGVNPSVNLIVGVHTVTLTVTDAEGLTSSDDVVITIEASENTDGCGDVAEWDTTETYRGGGHQVYLNGIIYESKWWINPGINPEQNSGQWDAWAVIGTCGANARSSSVSTGLSSIAIYPNPASSEFNVSATGFQSLTVFDVNGVVMIRSNDMKVNVSALHAGVYFIQVNTDVGARNLRLLVK